MSVSQIIHSSGRRSKSRVFVLPPHTSPPQPTGLCGLPPSFARKGPFPLLWTVRTTLWIYCNPPLIFAPSHHGTLITKADGVKDYFLFWVPGGGNPLCQSSEKDTSIHMPRCLTTRESKCLPNTGLLDCHPPNRASCITTVLYFGHADAEKGMKLWRNFRVLLILVLHKIYTHATSPFRSFNSPCISQLSNVCTFLCVETAWCDKRFINICKFYAVACTNIEYLCASARETFYDTVLRHPIDCTPCRFDFCLPGWTVRTAWEN